MVVVAFLADDRQKEVAMSLDPFSHCDGCFLRERTGGVCPVAREMGLENHEAQRRAKALHAAVLAEAPNVPRLIELVRQEAEQRHRGLLAAAQAALLAGPVPSPIHEPRKEVPCRLPM